MSDEEPLTGQAANRDFEGPRVIIQLRSPLNPANGATATLWDLNEMKRFGALLTGHTSGIRSATFS